MPRLGLILLLLLVLSGCGKKGALVPPEALVPAPIADLRVVQQGDEVLVSWSLPSKEEGGRSVRDLAGFRVLRREVLPAGEDCEKCPDAYREVKKVDLEYLQSVSRVGNFFAFQDGDVAAGKTYQYKVLSFKGDGSTSRDSNKPTIRKVPPPPAPSLTITPIPGGIELKWGVLPMPQDVLLLGYNVYRRSTAGGFPPFPLNERPLRDFRFEDRRLDGQSSYSYIVRTVAQVDGGSVESSPSNEVSTKDIDFENGSPR